MKSQERESVKGQGSRDRVSQVKSQVKSQERERERERGGERDTRVRDTRGREYTKCETDIVETT